MFGFGQKIPEISADEVMSLIEKKGDTIIVDVRTEAEVSRGFIEGSINIPIEKIDSIKTIIPDKNKKVILYCLSGSRSNTGVSQMIKMGYTNVFNMTNGLLSWRAKGFPLIRL